MNFYQSLSDFILRGAPAGLDELFEAGAEPAVAGIYRNGFYRSCRETLQNSFDSVASALGADRFAALAHTYAGRFPPQRGTLTGYGENFPYFLAQRNDLPNREWLVDLARLDWAWLSCLHGADGVPLTAADVEQLVRRDIDITAAPVDLLPNAQLVVTATDVLTSWQAIKWENADPQGEPRPTQSAQKLLLWRPKAQVQCHLLDEAQWLFLQTLRRARNLNDASSAAFEHDPHFDLSVYFAQLLQNQVLTKEGSYGSIE